MGVLAAPVRLPGATQGRQLRSRAEGLEWYGVDHKTLRVFQYLYEEVTPLGITMRELQPLTDYCSIEGIWRMLRPWQKLGIVMSNAHHRTRLTPVGREFVELLWKLGWYGETQIPLPEQDSD